MSYETMADVRAVNTFVGGDPAWPAYDFTTLNAIATCPTWGILRYRWHKAMSASGRAMALDAGRAAHDVYAAGRLWQLWHIQGLGDHAQHHGIRIFGEERWDDMCHSVDASEDSRNQYLNFALAALYNSGFYDDPADKRRTLANIEEACIAYLDRFNMKQPIYVADEDDHEAFVGVEIPIDVAVEYEMLDGRLRQYRLIGRGDGLHLHGDRLTLHENKTASRLGEAWAQSFHMSHQVTGYMIGLSTIIGQPIRNAVVHGMCIPLPRSYDYGGLLSEHVSRHDDQLHDFFEWFLNQAQIVEQWQETPWLAPKNTGSCNRYFRPCSFIPLCASPIEEREQIINEMVTDKWDPRDEAGAAGHATD